MKHTLLPLGLGAMLAAVPAFAAELSPGLWEISVETIVPGAEAFNPGANQITQCLTANDARDPSKMIGSISTPGATGCDYTDKSYTASTFRFTMTCTGSFGLKSQGEFSFSANSMNGSITATGNVGGKVTEFRNKVSARRLGNC